MRSSAALRVAAILAVGTAFLVSASPAFATTSLQTLPASDVSGLHATLHGHLATDEHGRLWFDLGTTTSYGTRVGEFSFGPDNITLSVTASVNPGTTYHFRFVAQTLDAFGNVIETYYGADETFQTAPARQPSVTDLNVTVSDDLRSATIAGVVDTGFLATSWQVEFGAERTLGNTSEIHTREAADTATWDYIPLTGITVGHPIYFEWVASNALGTVRSPLYYFLRSGPPDLAPPPPPPPPPVPPTRCRVPRAIGLTLARAKVRIRQAHCSVGRIRRTRSTHVGRVIAQSPRPGTIKPQKFLVKLTVGRR